MTVLVYFKGSLSSFLLLKMTGVLLINTPDSVITSVSAAIASHDSLLPNV